MSQDTRKDPRAKIVSLNVRYKSATVDEFIDNHSHDVSRGGLFIKTSTPFAQGTLLKFEIRLSSDQAVIAGVGRVVWKREPSQAAGERPAGMGVKFIKIDDRSRALIERLVTTKSDAGAAFAGPTTDDEITKVHPSVPPRHVELQSIKPTVSGMPAVNPGDTAAASIPPAPAAPSGGGFFPTSTSSEADMPPPQERTMMRQAAELLEEALKASGGSMEEVEQNPLFAGTPRPASASLADAPREENVATIGGFPTSNAGASALSTPPIAGIAETSPTPMVETPGRRSVPPAAAPERRVPSTPPPRGVEAARASLGPRPVRATDLLADSAPKKSGGALWGGIAAVVLIGGGAYAYQSGMLGGGSATTQPPSPTPSTRVATTPPVPSTAPVASASAAPVVSAATAASATPVASASAAPSASVAAAVSAAMSSEPVAVKPVETKPAPVAVHRPSPRPAEAKPVEAKPEEKPAETKPAETKPVEAKPEEKPAETKPAETKPAEAKPAEAKPADTKPEGETPAAPPPKKKKPPKEDSDNPY